MRSSSGVDGIGSVMVRARKGHLVIFFGVRHVVYICTLRKAHSIVKSVSA
jgi:hypothetical protein